MTYRHLGTFLVRLDSWELVPAWPYVRWLRVLPLVATGSGNSLESLIFVRRVWQLGAEAIREKNQIVDFSFASVALDLSEPSPFLLSNSGWSFLEITRAIREDRLRFVDNEPDFIPVDLYAMDDP